MQVFNFNTKFKRVEALDGHRIGMRSLENQTIYAVAEGCDTVKIHNMCVPVFKKIMSKKSEDKVVISQDKKYIRLEGKNYTYIIRRVEGEYFKVNQLLLNNCNSTSKNFKFVLDRKLFFDAMTYDADLAKMAKQKTTPVLLHSENGTLYSYINAGKYKAFDKLDTCENSMGDDLYIGFNPQFLADVFNVVDSDNPVCAGAGSKSPMLIYGNEYSFLVLPVTVGFEKLDYRAKFAENINETN